MSIDAPLNVLKQKNVSVKLRCPHQEPVLYVQEKISKLALSVTVCFPVDLCIFTFVPLGTNPIECLSTANYPAYGFSAVL